MTEGGRIGAGLLAAARVWLPVAIAVSGAVLVVIGGGNGSMAAAGVVLMGIALIVWMINWLFRLSLQSNRERDQEEAARRFYDEHGRWPED